MRYSLGRAAGWIGLFLLLAPFPLAIAWIGDRPPARTFTIELGVALGFIALGLFALQTVFSGRIRQIAPSFGMDNIIQFHREIGWIAALFVLVHPVLLIYADRTFLEYFDPRVNALRTIFLVFVTLAVLMIVATSLRRAWFRLPYEWWRLLHGFLALSILFIGLVHALQVQHYLAPLWKRAALASLIGASLYPVIHTRIIRPWRSRKRPYRVVEVEPERNEAWSLELEPVGHEGIRFIPGQFVWITLGDTPFSLQQHPFSIASSARRRRIVLTAKELGDFTSTWGSIDAGTPAYLEGPFGSFTPDPTPCAGLFLIMGGIGITPAMSMLRTMRDDGDHRPAVLIYGNESREETTFLEELEELEAELNLTVVHLPEKPPDGWEGEAGFVTRELLAKYLPEQPERFRFFICGPKPLMDVAEVSLHELGVTWNRIYTERFEIV